MLGVLVSALATCALVAVGAVLVPAADATPGPGPVIGWRRRGSPPGRGACPDRPGDQICRWEFPKVNDYTSHGCIKLAPAAVLALVRDYQHFFKPGVVYPKSRVHLLVR